MMISPLFCSVLLLTEHLLSDYTQISVIRKTPGETMSRTSPEFSLSTPQNPSGVPGYSYGHVDLSSSFIKRQALRCLVAAGVRPGRLAEDRRRCRSILSLPGYFSVITHFTLWSDLFYNSLTRILSYAPFICLHQLHR